MEISKYHVKYTGITSGSEYWRASIELRDSAGQQYGWIMFYDNDNSPPRHSYFANNRWYMYLPASQLHSVLDILRNEKPVQASIDPSGNLFLSTLSEPVGEGELMP